MAKTQTPSLSYSVLKKEILSGTFRPVYILSGEESFFPDELCGLITERALPPEEVDFNRTVLHCQDTTADAIVSICREYPMMSERKLVVAREAQLLKKTEALEKYITDPLPSTVLVLLFSGKSLDKRTSFYKAASAADLIFDSPKLELEKMPKWIEDFASGAGVRIEQDAALLLADCVGNNVRTAVTEIEKLLKFLPEGTGAITVKDVEKSVGVSREFSTSELTAALAEKDCRKALKIVYYFGESPKQYPIQMTIGWLFYFFSKVELIHAYALEQRSSRPDLNAAATKAGLFYRYAAPFISAARRYSLNKTMKIISLLREYDYKSKSNERGEATDGDLLTELTVKILN